MQRTTLQKLVGTAMLVAVEVVLSRFMSINTPVVKIGFGFVPIVLMALLFGPAWSAAGAAMADFIGAMLFPTGPYFAGFTFTALLAGAVYGLFLHKQPTLPRIAAAVLLVGLPLHLGLNTLWIHLLYDKGLWALLPGRFVQSLVMIPVQFLSISAVAQGTRLLQKNHA